LANAAFRVWTVYMDKNHKGPCPYAIDFTTDAEVSARKLTLDNDNGIWVRFNQSDPSKNITQMMTISLLDHKDGKKDSYFIQNVTVMYSENLFPGSNDTTVQKLSQTMMMGYPVALNSSYSCEAAAEIQLNVTDNKTYGLKILPAQWEAFSDFGNRTTLQNPAECPFDHNDVMPNAGAWNLTVTDPKSKNVTVCGKLEMTALVNVNYTSILGEKMVANFALPNDTVVMHDMVDKCDGERVRVTFMIKELEVNAANITFNFTQNQFDENSTKYWSLSGSELSFPNGNNPLFPNTDARQPTTVLSSNATLFNTTYGNAFKCVDKHWINTTTTWYIEISDVTLQPFNLTNEDFGALEDCTEDVKDDWLVPVIVGSVLGGLVIVVIVAYVIGRRRKQEPRYETM
jgi:hypothetical protein